VGRSYYGSTALLEAASWGNTKVVQLLLGALLTAAHRPLQTSDPRPRGRRGGAARAAVRRFGGRSQQPSAVALVLCCRCVAASH
jgi:hypothetical protein